MTEDYLHYVWKFRLFKGELKTTRNEPVEVLHPGEHNHDAGPDFFNARIRIGKTTWAGNVEIHLYTSDWTLHQHHKDQAYKNIILHVVFQDNKPESPAFPSGVPVVELKDNLDVNAWKKYRQMLASNRWIPCSDLISSVNSITKNHWLDRMMTERLEQKTDELRKLIERNGWQKEETFYQWLARNFGFRLNAVPFEMLARSLPLKFLARQKNNLLQVEALLFGQAGMLAGKFHDDYPNQLKEEYKFLQNKYSLTPMDSHVWKFARTRPGNFPTIRIAQFAQVIHRSSHLLSRVLEASIKKEIEKFFNVSVSAYWASHFRFDQPSASSKKELGSGSIDNILINTVAPFLFFQGEETKNQDLKDRAFELLEQIPGEKNSIIGEWLKIGMTASTAFKSQALLHLKKNYCDRKKCLNCSIGMKILTGFSKSA